MISAMFCEVLGNKDCILPHLFTGEANAYLQFYDQELSQIMADVYAEEIELFEYELI